MPTNEHFALVKITPDMLLVEFLGMCVAEFQRTGTDHFDCAIDARTAGGTPAKLLIDVSLVSVSG